MDYQQIITTTAQRVAPFVVDAVHGSSVLAARVLANPKPWNMGQYEQNPIQVSELTTNGDFVGLGQFDTADESTDINLQFTAKGFYQNITLPTALISLNQTEAGIIDLVKRKMDAAKGALQDRLCNRLYGLGTGDAIEGLQLQTDNATYSSSYGNQSRSTYGSYINGQVTAAAGGVISFATIRTQADLCSAASSSNDEPNLFLTTKAVWANVETLAEAKSRSNYDSMRGYLRVSPYTPMGTAVPMQDLPAGVANFNSLLIGGVPMVKDDKCPTGLFYTLNERYLKFVSLSLQGLKTISMQQAVTRGTLDENPVKSTAFQITDERMPTNSLGTVQQMIVYGNFINYNPKRSGVLTGVTGV